jgi:ribonuclease BN (tRNA processing enzyme)
VSHNGPTLGYRIEEDGHSLAYIPDHEPGKSMDLASVEVDWISGYGLAAGATVLLHDAQYSAEEYPSHIGWGHSSIEHVVTLARRAEVGRLVLFHHDPYHSDDELEAMRTEAVRLWGDRPDPPVLAHEGMVIEVGSPLSVRRDGAGASPPPAPPR